MPVRLLVPGNADDAVAKGAKGAAAQHGLALPQTHSKAEIQSPTANLRKIGSIAEEFVVEALLGKGSYGAAYRARRIRDGVVCAVKRVCMDGMSADDLRETLNEVKVLQSLHHPFVIEMQTCFLTSRHLNIVMPLADCGDLSSFIKSQGSAMAETDVLILFTQICCALKHVHDRKILHRDIKSANILLCTGARGNLEAKLADFGIARVLHGTMELASTAVGTPYYMSPELCKNESYDAKSDVWALGCLLYEMCTQKNPFTGVNFSGLALKILRGKYPPLPPSYSRHMSILVAMMLEVDANKRPSVAHILKLPFIASLLPRVLDKEILRREFSHTVLHGFCADDVKCAMLAVAADPRYEQQFQPLRALPAPHLPANHQPDREQEKPRPALQPRADLRAIHAEQDTARPNPVLPPGRQQHATAAESKESSQSVADGQKVIDRHENQRASPPHPASPALFQPLALDEVAPSAPAAAVVSDVAAAARAPVQRAQEEAAAAVQQPNEVNPPSAAFVIVHVETPMHLSKRGFAGAEPVARIADRPAPEPKTKLCLDTTVRADFTLLGATLQLEQKASSFEASASLRVEMLRAYLEKNLGVDVFCT
jgi:serine/threonine protein kinase